MLIPVLQFRRLCWAAFLLCLAAGGAQAQESGNAVPSFADQGDHYLIGPGDTLDIYVWREPELSVTVPVRPDGRITTPLVSDIVAVGKTPTQLGDEIANALAAYIRSPRVSVIVKDFVGVLAEQIRVIGGGIENGTVPYVSGTTVLRVVLQMGGLNDFGAGNRSKVIRQVNGEQVEIKVRLNDLLNKGRTKEDIAMQPGDILIVPESRF
jgi:polysaccharide export outer membrane protein